ncbi:MAG: hypothetical protein Q8Q31_00125 [Nanoarchaeota archaeon]|nr:hypothetical protein [Nanoarchaeota archaeon]
MLTALLLLFLAVPLGIYLSIKASDELLDGRKWFVSLFVLAVGLGIWCGLIGKYEITFTVFFMAIVSFISYVKSF